MNDDFQSNESTYDALKEFSSFLYENLEKGKSVLALFLDYRKAFDLVPHDVLLRKLEFYGIRGNILQWFRSYLTGRSQRTKYDSKMSDSLPIEIGLAQGSVLGPILFNLHINDLVNVSEIFRTCLFCDDSTLYTSGYNLAEMTNNANLDLLRIYEWCTANKMSLNTDKTVAMIFSNRRIRNCPPILLKQGMSYEVIKRVDTVKFLGIYYDENMKFKHHIQHLTSKISRIAGMIYRLSQILPTKILKKLYDAHVNSVLSYNTPIWCCNFPENIKPVITLQKKIIRSVTKSEFYAHSKPLFKKTNTLNVFDINKLFLGSLYFKNPTKYVAPFRRDHPHNTRNANDLRPKRYTKTLVRNSFLVKGPTNYNSIPENIKSCPSIISFKKNYKKFLLTAY